MESWNVKSGFGLYTYCTSLRRKEKFYTFPFSYDHIPLIRVRMRMTVI